MHLVSDRKGQITKENSFQDRILKRLYGNMIGRMILKPMILPITSKIGGKFLDTRFSKIFIPAFIRTHSINMEEYEKKPYTSYNDFFTRKMIDGARNIDQSEHILISPCDGRLSVYKISRKSIFSVKNTRYTAASLLQNKNLAQKFAGGYIWIFRLSVEDYHHYVYPDGGKVSGNIRIPGVFHTVNPVANDKFPIYKENTREYCLLKSNNFGTMLQMEVGALFVGKIENRNGKNEIIQRGQEKGNFAFGGSTVILMTRQGRAYPDRDILINSIRGVETKVKMGEGVGQKYCLRTFEKIV